MKRLIRLMAIRAGSVALVGTVALVASAARDGRQDNPLSRLSWLSGCWELRSGARLTEEQWMSPRGAVMLGMSRTSRNDSIVEFEQIRLESRPDGVYYVASPSRQATTEFKATEMNDSTVAFENPAHDFPKRIVYGRRGTDSLIAMIVGPRGGQTRPIVYRYRRAPC